MKLKKDFTNEKVKDTWKQSYKLYYNAKMDAKILKEIFKMHIARNIDFYQPFLLPDRIQREIQKEKISLSKIEYFDILYDDKNIKKGGISYYIGANKGAYDKWLYVKVTDKEIEQIFTSLFYYYSDGSFVGINENHSMGINDIILYIQERPGIKAGRNKGAIQKKYKELKSKFPQWK